MTAPPPFRVGLTGGIASGKSRAAEVFAQSGVPVIDSDVIAREVVAPGSAGLDAIRSRFGAGVLLPDGSLDRRALRERVFADPTARRDLEAITHPLIRQKMADDSARAGGPYQIHVIPLLAEGARKDAAAAAAAGDPPPAGRPRGFDRILVIDCPEQMQVARVMARDRVDEAGARAVLAAQASRADRLALADDVILNDRGPEALEQAVRTLHQRYLALAAATTAPAGPGPALAAAAKTAAE
jgi:dephospho-CoA kinase